jgi:hypothetical protein
VEHDNGWALAGIDVGDPKIADLTVSRPEVEVGQALKALVGCPECVRDAPQTEGRSYL